MFLGILISHKSVPISPISSISGLFPKNSRFMKKFDFHPIFCHLYAVVVVFVAFGVYLKTLAPTVSFFDSGELISAAYTLGVAHPPGYPLYVLVGWLFAKLPLGSVAYRLNVMSACFAALAAMTAYYVTYALFGIRPPADQADAPNVSAPVERLLYPVMAMIAALTFAFSPTHWQQAVIAEVYSLNAFLCGLILLLLLIWHRNRRKNAGRPSTSSGGREAGDPLLYLTAFLFGLGFGNHQMIALLSVAAVFVVLRTDWRILLRWKSLLLIVLCLGLGFTVYLQVPIRARANPPINWGNAATLKQFTWLITREGYAHVERGHGVRQFWDMLHGQEMPTEAHDTDGEQVPEQVPERQPESGSLLQRVRASLLYRQFATFNVLQEFGYFGLTLAVVGLGYGVVRIRIPTLTLVLAIAALVISLVLIGDPPAENAFLVKEFHTPAYLCVSVLIGLGLLAVARSILWLAAMNRPLQYGAVLVMAAAFLVLPATQMLGHLKVVDRRRNYIAYDYGANILRSLQPNAILFTWGDSGAFPLWYLHYVEGLRPDVTLIHVPHLGTNWYVESLPSELFLSENPFEKHERNFLAILDEMVRKSASARPIYFDYSSSHALMLPYELIPHGIVYKFGRPGDKLDDAVWSSYRLRGIMSFSLNARDLDRLRQESQITDEIVPQLHPLLNRVFQSEHAFLDAVAQRIGRDLTDKYREFLLIHGLFHPQIAHDPDINRTFLLYGSARLELGNFYLGQDQLEKAVAQFNAAVRFDASLGDGIVRMLEFQNTLGDAQLSDIGQ